MIATPLAHQSADPFPDHCARSVWLFGLFGPSL